jgi:hypothetical protein
MAGEIKYSHEADDIQTADAKLGKAYCEGRAAQCEGRTALTNPHQSGSDAWNAWNAGFEQNVPEGLVDSCAYAIPMTVPNVVNMTQANATMALTAKSLGLSVGGGAADPITAQNPAANAKAQPGSTVIVTLT